MCVGNATNCPYLTREEQLAQHQLEERKLPGGFDHPLIATIIRKVVEANLMTEAEYRERTIKEYNDHAIQGAHYGIDGPLAERQYARGEVHVVPPRDPLLSDETWQAVLKVLQENRFHRFHEKAVICFAPLQELREWPEFEEWFPRALLEIPKRDPGFRSPHCMLSDSIKILSRLPIIPSLIPAFYDEGMLTCVAKNRVDYFFASHWNEKDGRLTSPYTAEMQYFLELIDVRGHAQFVSAVQSWRKTNEFHSTPSKNSRRGKRQRVKRARNILRQMRRVHRVQHHGAMVKWILATLKRHMPETPIEKLAA